MGGRTRAIYADSQKAMTDVGSLQDGSALRKIAGLFDRNHSSVANILAGRCPSFGIGPRKKAPLKFPFLLAKAAARRNERVSQFMELLQFSNFWIRRQIALPNLGFFRHLNWSREGVQQNHWTR